MQINKPRMYAAMMMSPILLPHLFLYFLSPNNQLVKSDVGVKTFIYRMVWDPPYRNLFYQRTGRIHYLFSWLLFPACKYTRINSGMPLGRHCHLEHAHGTHLNAKSIGENFTCLHNVTLGQKGGRVPTIGNNVLVSAGACIIGGVTVGDNVIIGNNCVVVHDVPPNCTVVGNPARIVKIDGKKVDIPL